jgi:hypothetical protein
MRQRTPGSQQRQREFARELADDFAEPPLSNTVHDDLIEDLQLSLLCDATKAADDARDRRSNYHGEDAAFVDDLDEGWGKLAFVSRQRALEVVAEACKTVVQEGDQWVNETPIATAEIREAQQEAREWMRSHTTEMERVGWLPDESGEERIDLPLPANAEYDLDDVGDGEIVVQWWQTAAMEGDR